jgi:phosphoglycolate phosphatase
MSIRAILFDLDGTLVQTREASWQLFAETNTAFGLGIDTREQYFALFRDNFFRSLAACCPADQLPEVKRHFLGLLRTRYTPPFVPGMADVVRSLAASFTLVVLSTNTTETIRRVLTHAGLAHCFAHVFAGDVEPDKSVSMRRFLADAGYRLGRRCSPAYDEGGTSSDSYGSDGPGSAADDEGGVARFERGEEVVLVTDTVGDIKEAASVGVRAIGVAWGMHSEADLRAAGAARVALWPQELCAWILPEADPACAGNGSCACSSSSAGAYTSRADVSAHSASAARQLVLAAAEVRRTRRARPYAERPPVTRSQRTSPQEIPQVPPRPNDFSTSSAPAIDAQLLAILGRLRRAGTRASVTTQKGHPT